MRKTFLLLAALMTVSVAFADLSTGEPHSAVIPRTGNRPQQGDFGMYLGASVTQVIDIVKLNKNDKFGKNAFWALPAINLKYYARDNWEIRLGFQFAAKGESDIVKLEEYTYSRNQEINYTRFYPGFAYHFNTKNILDVYIGAKMPIGFNLENTKTVTGKESWTKNQNNKFVIGGGVFLGLQVFIADLPFAIGIETGYSGVASIGTGDRTVSKTKGNDAQYTVNISGAGEGGKDLSLGTDKGPNAHLDGVWGADAALTFTYYFRK